MTQSDDTEEILSKLYHSLRAARRRHVIQFLSENSATSVTTREISREIASLEQQTSLNQATGEPYRNVYNALSQTHLSTLSDAGIIIYDPQRQTVGQGIGFDLALLLLDTNTPLVNVITCLTAKDENPPEDTDNNHS